VVQEGDTTNNDSVSRSGCRRGLLQPEVLCGAASCGGLAWTTQVASAVVIGTDAMRPIPPTRARTISMAMI
jgi:hypothetical protein